MIAPASRGDGWAGEAGHSPVPPAAGGAGERIDLLDVLRGLAILSILFLNVAAMAASRGAFFLDGWSMADIRVFAIIHTLMDGTERGLLELLFGASALILTARAMRPDAPVSIADLFYRRNLWLLAFGLFDVFALLWIGDILVYYALAALFLFPFRSLRARWLLAIGLCWTLWSAVDGAARYDERAALERRVEQGDPVAVVQWRTLADRTSAHAAARAEVKRETAARAGGVLSYVRDHWAAWERFALDGSTLLATVGEAMFTMLIGMALWKWGITAGGRSPLFYGTSTLLGYSVGVSARVADLAPLLRFGPAPHSIWITDEAARLAITIGHLSLVNLLWKARAGRMLLAPFKAAGRVAFSIYLLQSLLAGWVLFAPWGPDLWGRYAWAGMAAIAGVETAGLLLAANLWLRAFAIGPMEWCWRSLSHGAPQRFRLPLPH